MPSLGQDEVLYYGAYGIGKQCKLDGQQLMGTVALCRNGGSEICVSASMPGNERGSFAGGR